MIDDIHTESDVGIESRDAGIVIDSDFVAVDSRFERLGQASSHRGLLWTGDTAGLPCDLGAGANDTFPLVGVCWGVN